MSNEQARGPSTGVSIQAVQQQTLDMLEAALRNNQPELAHCLAETYETLVRAQATDHQAMRVAVERALRQLEQARARAAAGPNAAVPKAALEQA